MAKHGVMATSCFAIFICLCLSGCVLRGPELSSRSTELTDTPFFPQKRYQCGPAALATVLSASGAAATPEMLTDRVYLPGRRGSLQVEMQAAPRGFARLALPLPRSLDAIVAEIEAGRPVLVLHNYGLSFWPRWHYAVVVGYDRERDRFVLRSGVTQRQTQRTRTFMVAWHHAGRWAMVVLKPGETAANADPHLYFESAADFERAASPADARAAFDAAVLRWPTEPVGLIGRGTAEYRLGDLQSAARDFSAALTLDSAQVGARNNLAQTLLDLKCPHRARRVLESVDIGALTPAMRSAVEDTRNGIEREAARSPDAAGCSAIP